MGKKRKPNRIGADAGGERVDPGSLSPPESPVVVGGSHDREDNEANANERQVSLTDQPPQPESVLACGSGGDQEGGEVDVDGNEVSQVHPHARSDAEVGVGSGPSGEGGGVYGEKVERVLSTHLASHDDDRETDGM